MATLAFFACIICRGPILGWLMDNCGTAHLSTSAVLFVATVLGDFFLSGHQLEDDQIVFDVKASLPFW